MSDRKAKLTVKGNQRKDGKYRVTYSYPGAPNMFGGFYPTKVLNKIQSVETIRVHINTGLYEVSAPFK